MLDAAAATGALSPDVTVLEASSGNTGAAVARIGAERGLDVEIVVPDDAGVGKIEAIRAAGAVVHTVDSDRGYDAFVEERDRRLEAHPDRYHAPDQYSNPANPGVHAGTTGPEIWSGTDASVTAVVAGVGSGGTVTGIAHALGPRGVTIYGYEPAAVEHDIPGLKRTTAPQMFVPEAYEPTLLDERLAVETATAHDRVRTIRRRHQATAIPIRDPGRWSTDTIRRHLRVDGEFLVGPSSGGSIAAVERLAAAGELNADDVVVVPLADRGDRYPERDIWNGVL